MRKPKRYVYLLLFSGNRVKIGTTDNYKTRIKTIAAGRYHPEDGKFIRTISIMEIDEHYSSIYSTKFGAEAREDELHKKYEKYRAEGRELFLYGSKGIQLRQYITDFNSIGDPIKIDFNILSYPVKNRR